MNYKEHILEALRKAKLCESKLTYDAFQTPGFTSPKIRHLLNNVGSCDELNYLEIGVHKGGTFVSALYKNNMKSATAVDNWSEFAYDGASRKEFFENCSRCLDCQYNVIERDCFSLTKNDFPAPINFYFYDGCHTYEAQYKALSYFYDLLDTQFIFMVDDFKWDATNKGTRKSIEDLKFEIVYEEELMPPVESPESTEDWWNGFYVSVLKKPT